MSRRLALVDLRTREAFSFNELDVAANERRPRVFASSRLSVITRHEANTGMQRPYVAAEARILSGEVAAA